MTTGLPRPAFILLGGVPGAGKTTALTSVIRHRPDVHAVDPESLRPWFDRRFGSMPYRLYRPVLHGVNAVRVFVVVLRGPRPDAAPLVVHDPATRPRRRRFSARLARARGWDPVLVLIDVSDQEALEGQRRRGRVVPRRSFARHWNRWQSQRSVLMARARRSPDNGRWSEVLVVDRANVVRALLDVLTAERPGTLRQGDFSERVHLPGLH